ncbi:MAG: translocation/assembly module TamB [Oscillatoriales cyanobacterium C42_A2020_001]|nr:translocation/assembly module TamB [Leptolyngbyaceae cyanobacterium C42_A2020_001]
MTHSPTPDRDPNSEPPLDPQPPRRPSRFRRVRRLAIPIGIVLVTGVGGAAFWGWRFIHKELPGIVAQNLSETLNRPVEVGDVEGVSLSGLVIGESSIPPTANDTDEASVETIEVGFNLFQTLMTGKLKLDITLKDAAIFLEQQKEGWITTRFTPQADEGRIEIGTIRVENATARLLGLGTIAGKRSAVVLNQLNGKIDLFDENKRFTYELSGQSATDGKLKLLGETLLPSQETNLQVQAENFLVSEVDRLLNLPFDLPKGRGGGNFNVELRPNIKNPPINGTARFEGVTLAIPGIPRPFTNAKGTLQFRGNQILPEEVVGSYGKAVGVVNGAIDLNKGFNLSAKVRPITLPDLTETLKLSLPFPVVGRVTADLKVIGSIENPILSGTARSVAPGRLDRVALATYSTDFVLNTANEELVVQRIQAIPAAGGTVTGSGRIDFGSTDAAGKARPELAFNFLVQGVPGDAIAREYNNGNPLPVTVRAVDAQALISGSADNIRTSVRWSAPNATYAGSGKILIADGVTRLQDTTFNVEGGTANIDAIAANGRWQAVVSGSSIPLNRFSPELRGLFSGKFTASGSLSAFSPANIRAQGTARFSEGIAVVDKPLVAQVQWNGQQLLIQEATAPGFSANGAIALRLEGTPAITGLDLNVRLDDYNLQDFAVNLPGNINYSGRTDFAGKITGTPTALNVNGNLALKQLIVNGVAFEPYLSGKLQYGQGVRLDLRGQQDRIAAVLDSRFRPIAFEIRRGDAIAEGRTQGELLLVNVKNFPLALAQLPGLSNQFSPSGTLNGTFAVNLDRRTATGDIAIAQPGLGGYRADEFTGRINFANGIATLIGGQLRRGQTILQLDASANLFSPDPKFKGQINIAQGNIQDVLEALQIFEIQDFQRGTRAPIYGRAADLQTVPIDATNVSIQTQLRRLAEIQALQAIRQSQSEAAIVPDLSELKGTFTGTIDVAGSLASGIDANFNIRGQDFQWGRFTAKQVVAVGNFQDGELTLLPLRLQSDDAVIAFSGQLLGANQSGQLRVEKFPIEQLADLVQLPIDVTGLLNATATISGSFENPQAVGQYNLNNAQLNAKDVQTVRGSFTYTNARLDFSNTIAIADTEPLYIVGSVPLKLFSYEPVSDTISLDINVQDEGLALLNILTNQVSWVDGRGEVRVQVRGTLKNPIAVGLVRLQDATLQARALPEPLTNVNGIARFVQDRIRVEQFGGDFSQGKVVASGVIPLANRLPQTDPDIENPLTVQLNKIALNLKGLYRGGVDGSVIITGAALAPVIGGNIQLSNGQVQLSAGATETGEPAQTGTAQASNIEFADLRLTLGNGVVLVNQPLLSFVARGDLTINGNVTNPEPSGTIQLTSGQVNLFTTQFTLERGYTQTAIFAPDRGLDPELNVRLVALVPEVTNRRQPSVLAPSEILDVPAPASSFGSLRTVRVRAEVVGPASRLSDNLELTSSPPRSESEIVALIGGGYVDTLGRGGTLLGLANLAGSALLANVQTAIGRTLGLSEFRLFPTFTTGNNRDTGETSGTLGLAAEAAVDITPALSVSVLKILTNGEPAQFGLRYRINNNLLLRSSTDFSGDTRASVEYELRF